MNGQNRGHHVVAVGEIVTLATTVIGKDGMGKILAY